MEIEVTKVVQAHIESDIPAIYCSGSQAELGTTAMQMTWDCSKHAGQLLELNSEIESEIRDHLREYGAWDDEEIDEYTTEELAAFVAQEVMAEVRRLEEGEGLDLEDFTEEEFYEATKDEGGRLYGTCDSGWYFHLGI